VPATIEVARRNTRCLEAASISPGFASEITQCAMPWRDQWISWKPRRDETRAGLSGSAVGQT
jgi:hypothetical protein